MSFKNLPKHQFPREKLIEKGVENLKNPELLAVLLRTGTKDKNVLDLSRHILRKFSLQKFSKLDYNSLVEIKGIEKGKACVLLAAFELASRAFDKEGDGLPAVSCAADTIVYFQDIRKAKKEHLAALYLDARNRVIHKEIVSVGTLNANLVHPREIFKPAIDYLAASVLIAHNHPSGDLNPSEEDIEITERIKNAGEVLGVELLDHLIVTKNSFKSLKNNETL
ncbi:MAG: DNA repair protein RadC [Candidatus Moraniibacteriota bacterium]